MKPRESRIWAKKNRNDQPRNGSRVRRERGRKGGRAEALWKRGIQGTKQESTGWTIDVLKLPRIKESGIGRVTLT